MSSIIITI